MLILSIKDDFNNVVITNGHWPGRKIFNFCEIMYDVNVQFAPTSSQAKHKCYVINLMTVVQLKTMPISCNVQLTSGP